MHAVKPNGDIGIVLNRKKTGRPSELNKRKQGKLSVSKWNLTVRQVMDEGSINSELSIHAEARFSRNHGSAPKRDISAPGLGRVYYEKSPARTAACEARFPSPHPRCFLRSQYSFAKLYWPLRQHQWVAERNDRMTSVCLSGSRLWFECRFILLLTLFPTMNRERPTLYL